MSVRNVLFLFFVSTAVLFTVSCNDEDDSPEFSEEDLTREDGWRQQERECNYDEIATANINTSDTLSALEKQAAITLVTNITAEIESVEDCERDDTYIFAESGDFEFVAGNNECQGQDDELTEFPASWEMDANTLIITDADGEKHHAEIKTLTASELVFRITDNPSGEGFQYAGEGEVYVEVKMVAN